jgi:predicted  nucleic acid-binding Zn-ribbon protein
VHVFEKKNAGLEERLSSVQGELSSMTSERDTLLQDNASISSRAEVNYKAFADLQKKLSQAAAEFAANSRQLQTIQNELKKANRRAEDAEKMQSDLQGEGMTLMRSLEEMRPKIVELTNIRLELVDKIEGLEGVIRQKEDSIASLRSALEEAKEKEVQVEKSRQREHTLRKKDESSLQDSLSQTHKAYGELQAELEALRVNLRDREAEREGYHQLALRRLEEVDRLTFSFQAQTERLTSVEKELEERRLAQTEDQGFVEGMQNEIEALRNDLAMKEEEFERLREPSSSLSQSLDGEMVSALKQQQTLELSNARSQIRALESAVFESDAHAHALQKQVSTLMDQLTQLRSLSHAPSRPFSPTPGLPSRPSSRAHNVSDELRRASMNSSKRSPQLPLPPPSPTPPVRRAFDSLSPETRHKRRVSLGMLKARIDSEVATSKKSQPPSRALTPLPESSEVSGDGTTLGGIIKHLEPHHIRGFRRHQFLDESHIFWCNSCHGDLVIL